MCKTGSTRHTPKKCRSLSRRQQIQCGKHVFRHPAEATGAFSTPFDKVYLKVTNRMFRLMLTDACDIYTTSEGVALSCVYISEFGGRFTRYVVKLRKNTSHFEYFVPGIPERYSQLTNMAAVDFTRMKNRVWKETLFHYLNMFFTEEGLKMVVIDGN